MNALTWLRSRRTAPRPATTAPRPALPFEPGRPAAADDRFLNAQPTGIVATDVSLTRDETDALRAGLTAAVDAANTAGQQLPARFTVHLPARAVTVDAVPAPETAARRWTGPCLVCAVRYSHCYCHQER